MSKQKIYITLALIIFSAFAVKTFASLTLNATTVAGSGDVVVSSAGTTVGTFSVPSGNSATSNFFNMTGTLPAGATAVVAAQYQITSAGSSAGQQIFNATLLAGYTGASATAVFQGSNSAAGTQSSNWSGTSGNKGLQGAASGTTTGVNKGLVGTASGSSTANVGAIGFANASTNSPAVNLGVLGNALLGTVNVGGYFSLYANHSPSLPSSSALIADNGAVAADIFQARDNGTVMLTIKDGGDVALGSTPKLLISQTAPTITSGFGTGASVNNSNGTAAFLINVGTGGAASSGTVGLPTANGGWVCNVNDIDAAAANRGNVRTLQRASTTTSVTIENQNVVTGAAVAWVASDTLTMSCFAF